MSIQLEWFKPATGGRNTEGTDEFRCRKVYNSKKNGVDINSCLVNIPERMMRSARFVVGDRVQIGFGIDPARGRVIALQRVPVGGYKLSLANRNDKDLVEKSAGKIARSRTQAIWRDGMYDNFSDTNGGHEVDESGTLLIWEGLK